MKIPATIPVYAANLPQRKERRESLEKQFRGRNEFDLHIVSAIADKDGAWGLWQTFCAIVSQEKEKGTPYFVFCEDDHVFTANYTNELLQACISEALTLDADLLSGGMSAIGLPLYKSAHLYQVVSFTGMQFTVVFQKAYDVILANRYEKHVTDIFLSEICSKKFVMYPFVSIQQEFGYSDVTSANNKVGRVDRLFNYAETSLHILTKVKNHYSRLDRAFIEQSTADLPDDMQIPTYVINLPERTDRLAHIRSQFEGREEFDVHMVEACRHSIGAVGLWQSVCGIVAAAKAADHDVILVCEDDHVFTANYNAKLFLQQVVQAGMMGADVLLGGVGGFGKLYPLQNGLFWTDWFWCTQFTVIYKSAYESILQADFKETDVADEFLSKLFSNKMVIGPFISKQVDFGYSDVTRENNQKGKISSHFALAEKRMSKFYSMLYGLDIRDNMGVYDEYMVSDYLRSASPKALNIGCGTNILPGWLNTDVRPEIGAVFMNAAFSFPFDADTFDYVYSEHLLEHLTYDRGKFMLSEAFRVLKPNGVLRLAVPTLDFLLKMYANPTSELTQSYVRWSLQQYAPSMFADFEADDAPIPVSLVLNNYMRFWGHSMLYDRETLFRMLEKSGFSSIEIHSPGESNHSFLRNLELHDRVIPAWVNDLETVVVEAHK